MESLRPGTSTPEFVEIVLSVFGKNPHGQPNFRLIWSERKMISFMGEECPEYLYLPTPCWVLETWVPPEKFAGSRADWGPMQEMSLGEYPRHGAYSYSQSYPTDWYPTVESVRLIAKGITESRDIAIADREKAIRKNLEDKSSAQVAKTAEAIVELQDSASMGRIQQSVTGPKNTFRTPEDFERDQAKVKEYANMPKVGGKLVN